MRSRAVENVASVSRTSSDRPWTWTNQPSVARSTLVTSHSWSRTTTTEPGAAEKVSACAVVAALSTESLPLVARVPNPSGGSNSYYRRVPTIQGKRDRRLAGAGPHHDGRAWTITTARFGTAF